MYQRFAEQRIGEALADTPVVLIIGPRRAGKTTLARKMQTQGRTYITLDDQGFLDAARHLLRLKSQAARRPSLIPSSQAPLGVFRLRNVVKTSRRQYSRAGFLKPFPASRKNVESLGRGRT